MRRPPEISASILNADFALLGPEVERATAGGVDSIHLDVMDGHFVDNISFGAPVVAALRPRSRLPFHAHLMIDRPLLYAADFVAAGCELIVGHLEAADDPAEFIAAVHATGRQVGVAIKPETPAADAYPYLADIELLVVMTVQPGFGGQPFMLDILPKLAECRAEIDRRGLALPIAVDGGVNLDSIGRARAAGGDVLVTGKALYAEPGDLRPVVDRLRAAASSAPPS